MFFSILSQASYAQVPFGDMLSNKAAAVNFAFSLTASFIALQPAFQDLVHTFLGTEVPTMGYISTLAQSASFAVMGVTSAAFSNKPGSTLTYKPPTPTIRTFESSAGHGPLIGAIACATFSVVGAAIAVSGRSRSSARSSSARPDEGEETPEGETPDSSGGSSGEDPDPPGNPSNDATQSEGTDSSSARAGNAGGSGPPPPPPPPSFNVIDAGDAGDWLALIALNWLGFLLMVHAFASKASPIEFKVKATAPMNHEKAIAGFKPRNSTMTMSVDDLLQYPTLLSRDAVVSANEMYLPLPCLDVVKPVLSTTCPDIISFLAPAITLTGVNPSPLLENAQSTSVFASVPRGIDWKTIILESLFALICLLGSATSYVSAIYLEDQIVLKNAKTVNVSTPIAQQPDSEVPGMVKDSIIEESASNGLILQDEDGLVELEDTIDVGKDAGTTIQRPEVPNIAEDYNTFEEESAGSDPVLENEDTLVEQERTADVGDEIEDCDDVEQYKEILASLSEYSIDVMSDSMITVAVELEERGVEIKIEDVELEVEAEATGVEVEVKQGEGQNNVIEDAKIPSSIDHLTVAVEEEIAAALASGGEVNQKENVRFEDVVSFRARLFAVVAGLIVGAGSSPFEDIDVNSSEGFVELEDIEVQLANTITAEDDVASVVEDTNTIGDVEVTISEEGVCSRTREQILVVTAEVIGLQIDGVLSTDGMLPQDNIEAVAKAGSKHEVLLEVENLSQELGEMSGESSQESGRFSQEPGGISQRDEGGCGEESAIKRGKKGKRRGTKSGRVQGKPVTPISGVVIETLEEGTSVSSGARTVIHQAPSTKAGLNPEAPILDPNFRPRVLRTEDVVQCDVDQPPRPIATHTTTPNRKRARRLRRNY